MEAQVVSSPTDECATKSFPELFIKKDSTFKSKPVKNSFFILIPVVGAQPATGFVYGGVAQYTFKGKNPEDKYSSINLGTTYTTKKQLMFNAKNNILLKNNAIFLSGDWRYYVFSQDNYGLGTDIVPYFAKANDFDWNVIREPMKYDYYKFHQTISFKVKNNLFVGAGVHLDGYSNIEDSKLDVPNQQFTQHYLYNQKNDFSVHEYYVNGFSLNTVFDSRDNQVNASKGWFGNINYRINPSFGENQKASSMLTADFRYFKPLSSTNKQHILGFWFYGQFLTTGVVPYLNLPAIGWDQRSRSGRGFSQGTFRGENLLNFETEYRFPILCNQLISGTLFANFTSTSDSARNIKIMQYVQPAIGFGIRVLLDKSTRTNLIVNYAWGHKSDGFYLNAGESF